MADRSSFIVFTDSGTYAPVAEARIVDVDDVEGFWALSDGERVTFALLHGQPIVGDDEGDDDDHRDTLIDHLALVAESPTDLVLRHLKIGHGVEPEFVDQGQEVDRHMRAHSVACPNCTYRAIDQTDLAEHDYYNHKEQELMLIDVGDGKSYNTKTDEVTASGQDGDTMTDAREVTVIVTKSAGSDGAVVVFIDTNFEPSAIDGGPGLRVLINDHDAYIGVPHIGSERENGMDDHQYESKEITVDVDALVDHGPAN